MNYRLSFFLIGLLVLPTQPASAAFQHFTIGTRQMALAGADVALPASGFGMHANPAGMVYANHRKVEFFYNRPFGLKELTQQSIGYSDPLLFNQHGVIGLGAMTYGFELYKETRLGLSYARALHPKLAVGGTLDYNQLSIKGYGQASCLGIDIGVLTVLHPSLTVGFRLDNLNQPEIGKQNESIPLTYRAGLAYFLDEQTTILMDWYYEPEFDLSIQTGLELSLVEFLSLQVGYATQPATLSGGFGLHYGNLDVMYAVSSHSDLGLSHAVGIGFNLVSPSSSSSAFRFSHQAMLQTLADVFKPKPSMAFNLNTATAKQLKTLPGITRSKVRDILLYRHQHNGFQSLEELLKIKGIGPKWLEKVKPYLFIEE
jgi:competence ComEA-like helix-hairpin-helix protein